MDPFSTYILTETRHQDYLRNAEQSRLVRAACESPDKVKPEAGREHGQGRELESGFIESRHR